MGFSDSGRLQVDVKLASFATRARSRVQQVKGISHLTHAEHMACREGPAAAALLPPGSLERSDSIRLLERLFPLELLC